MKKTRFSDENVFVRRLSMSQPEAHAKVQIDEIAMLRQKVESFGVENDEKDKLIERLEAEIASLKESKAEGTADTFDATKLMEQLENENIALKNVCLLFYLRISSDFLNHRRLKISSLVK